MTKSNNASVPGARTAGAVFMALLALAGCSAGQVAQTAQVDPSIAGLNTQTADGALLIRNLQVLYNTPAGYPADGTAPLQVSLFNETTQALTVVIRSVPQTGHVSAERIGLIGGAAAASPSRAAEPSGNRPSSNPVASATEVTDPSQRPSTPPTPGAAVVPSPIDSPLQTASITLPALSSITFQASTAQKLLATGLSEQLRPGMSLSLVFDVSTSGQPLTLLAPMEMPMSPVSRLPGTPPNKNISEE